MRRQCATLSAEIAVLNAISEAITQDKDIDLVLRDILAACCDAGGVSIGALFLRGGNGNTRTIAFGGRPGRAGAGPDGEPVSEFARPGDAQGARALSRPSATAEERAWLERNGVESAIIVPLQHKERVLGTLVISSNERPSRT